MKMCWVTLNVTDLEESLKFYRDIVGLELFSRFPAGNESEIAMLGEADKPKIELICNKNFTASNKGEGVSIGFEGEALDKVAETLRSYNINILKGPISPSAHIRFFFVKDPDGYEIQFIEHK
ncbi:MAG: VOC family protein [Bacillota bacterium]|nr:VOC family protein [Bacillota bacterium]